MRETKFRALVPGSSKSWLHGCWVYGFPMNDSHTVMNQVLEGCRLVEIVPKTLGQYTGLKDKNGKEIYEGDIVYAPLNKSTGVIKYGKYRCHWSEDDDDYHYGFHTEDTDGSKEGLYPERWVYEIIGNIHENPELLEET